MPTDTTSAPAPPNGEDFSQKELSVMIAARTFVEDHIEAFDARQKHRVLLGTASELIDACADVTTTYSPGVRVVELGLLAERVSQLARQENDPHETDNVES